MQCRSAIRVACCSAAHALIVDTTRKFSVEICVIVHSRQQSACALSLRHTQGHAVLHAVLRVCRGPRSRSSRAGQQRAAQRMVARVCSRPSVQCVQFPRLHHAPPSSTSALAHGQRQRFAHSFGQRYGRLHLFSLPTRACRCRPYGRAAVPCAHCRTH